MDYPTAACAAPRSGAGPGRLNSYVSDKYAGQPDALLDVPAGGGFADMAALQGDKEIGDKMNKIVARLAEANELRGVIDVADWNDPDKLGRGAEMVERLSNLVGIFAKPELDFSGNRDVSNG